MKDPRNSTFPDSLDNYDLEARRLRLLRELETTRGTVSPSEKLDGLKVMATKNKRAFPKYTWLSDQQLDNDLRHSREQLKQLDQQIKTYAIKDNLEQHIQDLEEEKMRRRISSSDAGSNIWGWLGGILLLILLFSAL